MSDPKILIIGAGASGLAAACRLLQKGLRNVTILEAKDRIGGRIHTVNFADNVIDLGAQWVHGEEGNVVFELANPHNLLDDSDCNENGLFKNLFSDAQGKIIPPEQGAQAMNIYYKISGSDTEELKEWNGSYGDFVKNKFYKQYQENRFTSSERASQFLEWIEKYDNHMQCSDSWFDVSAKRMIDFRNCEGNPAWNWKTKGFKTILDLLMKSYPSDEKKLPVMDKIIFNNEVSNINYSSNDEIVVTTSNGSSFNVSHVIFTPSLGVLKNEHRTLFTPSLLEVKERAIEGFSIGVVNKFFLNFPYRWWPAETNGLSFLWSKEDKDEFLSEYGEDNLWLCDVFIFFVVESHQSVLCGWTFGESARFTETLTDAEVSTGLYTLLQKFYGKTYDIPKPTNFTRSKWFTDKHICGGYSFRSMKTEKMDVKSYDLADPITTDICKPVILFAGEATHEYFYSTVHGAIESGFREAERLLDYYRTHIWPKSTRRCPAVTEKTLDSRESLSEITRMVIVGAGIAGLGAARTLEKQGFDDYILLEAMNRVGGRIHTIFFDEDIIEYGAQFLHGDKSDLGQFCHQLSLLSDDHSGEAEGVYIRDDGLEIESHFVTEVDDFVRYTLEECEQYASKNQILHPEMGQNIGQILRTRFIKYLNDKNDTERVRNIMEELFDWNIKFLNIDNSCLTVDELSAKGWGKFKFVGGQEHSIFKAGYSSVIKAIADSLNQSNLRLNSPVEKVEWKEEITKGDKDLKPVVLILNDNRKIFADCAIITCSLGYLKENHEKIFHPLLPHHLRRGIESLGFGLINKIFLVFDEVWWKAGTKGFQFIWRKEIESNINQNEKLASWTKYLTGFDILQEEKNGVLLGWIGGRGAHIIEKLSEQQVAHDCLKLLKVFLKGKDIPFPRRCLRTRWYNNKFVRGAYSHITTECDRNDISPANLTEPVWGFSSADNGMKRVPIMMLAGEGTHEHFYSTTHGAYDSGVKQANMFLRYHVEKESYLQSYH